MSEDDVSGAIAYVIASSHETHDALNDHLERLIALAPPSYCAHRIKHVLVVNAQSNLTFVDRFAVVGITLTYLFSGESLHRRGEMTNILYHDHCEQWVHAWEHIPERVAFIVMTTALRPIMRVHNLCAYYADVREDASKHVDIDGLYLCWHYQTKPWKVEPSGVIDWNTYAHLRAIGPVPLYRGQTQSAHPGIRFACMMVFNGIKVVGMQRIRQHMFP